MTTSPITMLAAALKAAGERPAREAIAAYAGVEWTVLSAACKGQAVGVDAYLRLCAAAGIDPLDGRKRARKRLGPFHWNSFGIAVRMHRIALDLSLRAMAAEIGVSATALCRIEGGAEPPPDALMGPVGIGAVVTVCRALELHPYAYALSVAAPVRRETPAATKSQEATAR